jgi:hypothetical protein
LAQRRLLPFLMTETCKLMCMLFSLKKKNISPLMFSTKLRRLQLTKLQQKKDQAHLN